jgi:hypothetical protein
MQQAQDALRTELSERLEIIRRLAAALAAVDCDSCEGEGMDYEGDEWALCECVMTHLQ